mmetsp:Transcript_33084/g.98459  ORF Transcript_33084/g.98459 Transcript_33084/m.98459 type:complete len:256 (+) Transcript_33084:642-1409(+)
MTPGRQEVAKVLSSSHQAPGKHADDLRPALQPELLAEIRDLRLQVSPRVVQPTRKPTPQAPLRPALAPACPDKRLDGGEELPVSRAGRRRLQWQAQHQSRCTQAIVRAGVEFSNQRPGEALRCRRAGPLDAERLQSTYKLVGGQVPIRISILRKQSVQRRLLTKRSGLAEAREEVQRLPSTVLAQRTEARREEVAGEPAVNMASRPSRGSLLRLGRPELPLALLLELLVAGLHIPEVVRDGLALLDLFADLRALQ